VDGGGGGGPARRDPQDVLRRYPESIEEFGLGLWPHKVGLNSVQAAEYFSELWEAYPELETGAALRGRSLKFNPDSVAALDLESLRRFQRQLAVDLHPDKGFNPIVIRNANTLLTARTAVLERKPARAPQVPTPQIQEAQVVVFREGRISRSKAQRGAAMGGTLGSDFFSVYFSLIEGRWHVREIMGQGNLFVNGARISAVPFTSYGPMAALQEGDLLRIQDESFRVELRGISLHLNQVPETALVPSGPSLQPARWENGSLKIGDAKALYIKSEYGQGEFMETQPGVYLCKFNYDGDIWPKDVRDIVAIELQADGRYKITNQGVRYSVVKISNAREGLTAQIPWGQSAYAKPGDEIMFHGNSILLVP
jgi:hypothetical protein